MKILLSSTILPYKNNIRIEYINSVIDFLRTKIDVKVYWLIYQPNNVKNKNTSTEEILDIHDFSSGTDLIKKIKPDVYLANHSLDPINAAISLASVFFNVPVICFDHSFYDNSKDTQLETAKFRLLLLNKMPSDTESEKKTLRRLRFYFFKYYFLLKTRINMRIDPQIILLIFKETFDFFTGKFLKLNPYGKLYLVSGEYTMNSCGYKKLKNKKQVKIVGNPYWDKLSRKIRNHDDLHKSNKIKILIITDSLFEHGIWTSKQRDEFLSRLFNNLNSDKNITFDIKIHSSSESMSFYKSFLQKIKINTQIFQSENLWDIAKNYDILLSYGYSQAHAEIAYSGKQTIFLDANIKLPLMTLIKEGIQAGHIKQCENDNSLISLIHSFNKEKIELSDNFKKICSKFFAIAEGNSAEKIGKLILDYN